MNMARFRRTKSEIERGLSSEEARLEREGIGVLPPIDKIRASTTPKARNGNIVIHLRPAKGVDADYFEHVPAVPVQIILDEHWYKWFDNRSVMPYDGDTQRLLTAIFDRGMNEVVSIHKIE